MVQKREGIREIFSESILLPSLKLMPLNSDSWCSLKVFPIDKSFQQILLSCWNRDLECLHKFSIDRKCNVRSNCP